MRISLLALFLSLSTTAFCQANPTGSASSGKLSNGASPAAPTTGFDSLPPNWQTGIAGRGKTSSQPSTNFFREWKAAPIDPKMGFQLQLQGTPRTFAPPLLALNSPSLPKIVNPWPNGKAEPIPTQFPDAKMQQIPTQWPKLKMLETDSQRKAPSATQAPVK